MLFTFVLIATIASSLLATTPLCNFTQPDTEDPDTLELAKIDLLKCQMELNAKQHRETLAAIKEIGTKTRTKTSRLSISDVLVTICVTSITLYVLRLLCRTVWYVLIHRFDNLAELMVLGQSCGTTIGLNGPSYANIQEYRTRLKTPWIVTCYKCCRCRGRTQGDEVIELP